MALGKGHLIGGAAAVGVLLPATTTLLQWDLSFPLHPDMAAAGAAWLMFLIFGPIIYATKNDKDGDGIPDAPDDGPPKTQAPGP